MAEAHTKHHDYHLVDPSPWPAVGSLSAFVMAVGAITWMHHMFPAAPLVFGVGVIGVLYTFIAWWRDVINEAEHEGFHTRVVQISHRYGMILFIASEVMFFVAWFWIFFDMALFPELRVASPIQEVSQAWAAWPPKGVELVPAFHLPLVNTLTLLLSGTTVTWAHHALQQDDRKGAKIALALTIVLGVLFTSIQAYEYNHILHEKLFYSEEAANSGLYGSAFFMATGFHGFHVLVGTIFLIVCLIRLMAGGFSAKQHFGFEAAAWYWHFVDVVWLFLFAFIYVVFGTP